MTSPMPAPRRLIEPDDETSPPLVPEAPIATLEAPPEPALGDDPRTGEPRIPRTLLAAATLSYLAVATVMVGLLWVYWNSVPMENFANASWLVTAMTR